MAHLHALLPLKLTFSHQPLLPIPILMTKISKLLSTPHPPSQCPLLSFLHKVRQVLLQLNTSKSSSPDGIPAIVPKSCAPELASLLNKLFQLSYNLGISLPLGNSPTFSLSPKKVKNLTLQTITLLQSLLSSLRLWRPLSPNNCLPSLKQTAFFLIINMGFDKPDLPVTF